MLSSGGCLDQSAPLGHDYKLDCKQDKKTKIYRRAIILIYCLNPDFSRCRFHETTTIIKRSHIEMYIIRNRAIKKRSNPIEILVLIQKYLQRLDNSFI